MKRALTQRNEKVSPLSRALEARSGFPARRGATTARAALARLLWTRDGERRIPSTPALDRALSALPRGELEWIAEFNGLAPLYLIPTRPFLRALAKTIRGCGARRVLEVAAGDGHLTRSLRAIAPELDWIATDSGAWERPEARMTPAERRRLRGVAIAGLPPGAGVERLEARAAIRRFAPDLVLASWLPPGPTLARLIRAPVRHVLEIGAGGGITGDSSCWRFEHDFLDEVEALGRCRLDERPRRERQTRVTLYFGAAHEDYAEDRDRWRALRG